MNRSIQFTPQQAAILQASTSVAVSAGAGCGKTFVLTQRFVSHLRTVTSHSDPLSTIVAITFTEKAAREMRERVRIACDQELIHCERDLVDYWLDIIRGLDAARISTIHAFCSSILRRFAVEASLDPAFALLDTSFGDSFARRSVREGISQLLEEHDPDAINFVVRYGIEGTFQKMRSLLYGATLADLSRFDGHTPSSLADVWKSQFRDVWVPRLFKEFWESSAVVDTVKLLRNHEPLNAVMIQRRALLLEYFDAESTRENTKTLATMRENAQVKGGGGKKGWESDEIYQDVMAALKSLREEVDGLLGVLSTLDEDPTEAATLALTAHRLVRSVAERHALRKREESRLDFDDLLCQTRDLLSRNSSVRRRASLGIELLMVDEFQDTDPVQADLVRFLCGDALSSGKLFLVGDSKQSIYRFRRADPRVFASLRNELPEPGRLPLSVNFRSQPAILKFVNFTFAGAIEDYEPLEPVSPIQLSPEPSVEFLFSHTDEKLGSASDQRKQEADWIADRICQLLDDPTPRVIDLESKQPRQVRPGDIAILFRTLSNVHLYEQSLVRAHLPYYLAGGRAFFAQQEIHDVVHLCRWLDDPSDELSLVGVLRSPFFGLNDDTIFLLKPTKSSSILDGLENPPKLSEVQGEQVRLAASLLSELASKKDRVPLASLLNLAIERTGYDAALLCEHLGERKLANLQKLIGLARSFDGSGQFTLSDFADRLREAVYEQADEELAVTHPEVGDVIRLMTIHQSKGLEFPIVVVADMDWRRVGGDSDAYYHPVLGPLFSLPDDVDGNRRNLGQIVHRLDEVREDEAEQLRLLYVAVTRAKDHLILSAGLNSEGKLHSSWMKLLARKYDLLTGLPSRDPYLGSFAGSVEPSIEFPDVMVHLRRPEVERKNVAKTDRIALTEFRHTIAECEVAPLPLAFGKVTYPEVKKFEWTVSELCATDDSSESKLPFEVDQELSTSSSTQMQLFEPDRYRPQLREDSQKLGTICHAVLERVIDKRLYQTTDEEFSKTVRRSVSLVNGKPSVSLERAIERKLKTLFSHPLWLEMTSADRIHSEVDFRLRRVIDGEDLPFEVVGTIDCIFRDNQGNWHLLDYKIIDDERTSDRTIILCYRLQLAIYACAIEEFFGVWPQTTRIVRIGAKTKTLPISWDLAERVNVKRRIDSLLLTTPSAK